MSTDRFIVLGFARPRTPWFDATTRWSTSGSLAVDFVKCVSADEVRVRLSAGRATSAVLLDGSALGVDRDLIADVIDAGAAPIVVDASAARWERLGAPVTLEPDFDLADLAGALGEVARPVLDLDDFPPLPPVIGGEFRAGTIAVTGAGGAGTSTVAMALAQGFGADARHSDTTVLADLALHADQAMLHDVGDLVPGILDLVDAHRTSGLDPAEIRRITFDIAAHRYRILLGLPRHRDWTSVRPRALRSGLAALMRAFTLAVLDVGCDLEGESCTGSADVEDRNLLAREAMAAADVVVVVGAPGIKGTHSMLRVIRDCVAHGVDGQRIVPVVNRVPRSRRLRAESISAMSTLLACDDSALVLTPTFLPDHRGIEDAIRSGSPLPMAFTAPLVSAVRSRLDHVDPRAWPDEPEPMAIVPGSLGLSDLS